MFIRLATGVVVMGGDSCSERCGFESQLHILDVHISHIFVANIVMFVCKDENKWKEATDGPYRQPRGSFKWRVFDACSCCRLLHFVRVGKFSNFLNCNCQLHLQGLYEHCVNELLQSFCSCSTRLLEIGRGIVWSSFFLWVVLKSPTYV